MPGSEKCPHGFESGKDCEVCFEEWRLEHNKKFAEGFVAGIKNLAESCARRRSNK